MIKKIILEFLNSKFLENNTFYKYRTFKNFFKMMTACSFFWIFWRKTEYLNNQKDQMGLKRFPARVNPTK